MTNDSIHSPEHGVVAVALHHQDGGSPDVTVTWTARFDQDAVGFRWASFVF